MRTAAVILTVASLVALAAPATAAGSQAPTDPPAARESKPCKKLPAGKRVLKMNMKPDSDISDLVAWMSTISCQNFLFIPSELHGKKFTLHTPGLLTPEEAYQLFVDTLASVDLAVEPVSSAGGKGETLRIRPKRAPGH